LYRLRRSAHLQFRLVQGYQVDWVDALADAK